MILLLRKFLLITLCLYSFNLFSKIIEKEDIYKICKSKNFYDCNLIIALAEVESNFNAKSYNPEKTGSFGLLQIQCGTAKWMGHNNCKKLYDPLHNIKVGILYLDFLQENHNIINVQTLIAAWNAGRPIVCKHNNPGFCKPGQFYNQAYVNKVYELYKIYKKESPSYASTILLKGK
jgi:soluble lytic murein transglycosylase-like protein